VAMTFEAAIGDRGGVEREFALVSGNADALDPGNGPSEATEALYAAIQRRWREGERAAGAGVSRDEPALGIVREEGADAP
jgi:hypothetical protein